MGDVVDVIDKMFFDSGTIATGADTDLFFGGTKGEDGATVTNLMKANELPGDFDIYVVALEACPLDDAHDTHAQLAEHGVVRLKIATIERFEALAGWCGGKSMVRGFAKGSAADVVSQLGDGEGYKVKRTIPYRRGQTIEGEVQTAAKSGYTSMIWRFCLRGDFTLYGPQ